ncbi:MAG: hypothetical protein L0Y66_12385 [Myxococcaceae bacterium]|nr:hypothetical protein [Myxococcaceae bacterium]MCI0671759.1 hypothetical protein [Myxococcaceae bacterium]
MSGPGFHPPPPQREDVSARRVLAVLGAVLTLFALSVWATVPILRAGAPAEARESRVPGEVGHATVGRVNQEPFDLDTRAEELRERQRHQLSSYGWVDRDAGVIHVPIERAVELLLQQEPEAPE